MDLAAVVDAPAATVGDFFFLDEVAGAAAEVVLTAAVWERRCFEWLDLALDLAATAVDASAATVGDFFFLDEVAGLDAETASTVAVWVGHFLVEWLELDFLAAAVTVEDFFLLLDDLLADAVATLSVTVGDLFLDDLVLTTDLAMADNE